MYQKFEPGGKWSPRSPGGQIEILCSLMVINKNTTKLATTLCTSQDKLSYVILSPSSPRNDSVTLASTIRGCANFDSVTNFSLVRRFCSRTGSFNTGFIERSLINVEGGCSNFVLRYSSDRIGAGSIVLYVNTARGGLKVSNRGGFRNEKMDCYTIYSNCFFGSGAITMVNKKGATIARTACLSRVYGQIFLVRENGTLGTSEILIRGLRGSNGIGVLCGAGIIGVSNSRGIGSIALSGRGVLGASNIFITMNLRPEARYIGNFMGASSGNCIVTSRAYRASISKVFITKSVHAGGLQRVVATYYSNTGSICKVGGFLGLWNFLFLVFVMCCV